MSSREDRGMGELCIMSPEPLRLAFSSFSDLFPTIQVSIFFCNSSFAVSKPIPLDPPTIKAKASVVLFIGIPPDYLINLKYRLIRFLLFFRFGEGRRKRAILFTLSVPFGGAVNTFPK